jgi:hypothetical protein
MDFSGTRGLSVARLAQAGRPRSARLGQPDEVLNGGALEHAQEMAAHESPRTTNFMIEQRNGLPRTKWRELGFRWWLACNRAPLGGNIDLAFPDGLSRYTASGF